MVMGQGRGGGAQAQQIFTNFLEGDMGDLPKFLTEEAVIGNFFFSIYYKRKHCFVDFF